MKSNSKISKKHHKNNISLNFKKNHDLFKICDNKFFLRKKSLLAVKII